MIRRDLRPWICDLLVDTEYQKKGIVKLLLGSVTKKAKEFGFQKLYLFAFDPNICNYYKSIG